MKKFITVLVIALAISFTLSAADPGIYLKSGENMTPIKVTRLGNSKSSGSAGGFGVSKAEHKIKGVTSGLKYTADDSFIFVFSPKTDKKIKLPSPFSELSTTENFVLYKLEVTKKERKVATNVEIMGFKAKEQGGAVLPFTQLDDDTYEVKLENLESGEYAFFYTSLSDGGKKAAALFNADPVSWDESWCFTVE